MNTIVSFKYKSNIFLLLFAIILVVITAGYISCEKPEPKFIDYSATGAHGANILSNAVTSVKANDYYSMKADVPKGMSLKIVLKDGIWAYEVSSDEPVNWKVSQYDNLRQEFIVIKSGKLSDLKIEFWSTFGKYITIEYYENGDKTPTKTKILEIIPS